MSKSPKWLRKYRKKLKKAKKNWDAYGVREQALRAMGFSSYKEYLASDLWKGIRSRRLSISDGCSCCDNKADVVHHDTYHEKLLRGDQLAVERDLYPLCHGCHLKVEFSGDRKRSWQEAVIKFRQMLFRFRNGVSKGQMIRQKIAAKKAARAAKKGLSVSS